MNNHHLPMLAPSQEELLSYSTIAQTASKTPYWNKLGGETGILSIMLMAREIGISPMNAISGMIHVIQGKVEVSSKGMLYLIRKNGHKLSLKLLNDSKCVLEGERKDTGEKMEASFTIEEARNSGLIKPNSAWTKCPQDMLYWRALSRLARRLFTDCIGGCYVEGELSETIEKKPMTEVPVADIEEIEIDAIELEIPDGVDIKKVEEYISEISETTQCMAQDVRNRALQNPERFWETFHQWNTTAVIEEVKPKSSKKTKSSKKELVDEDDKYALFNSANLET